MNKQVLGAIVTSVIILAATLVPSLANASSLFDFFCAMTRAGAASGPQQNSCLLQQGQQLLNQAQQNQGVNQNPCPSGTQLVGLQCLVINGLNSAATTAAQQLCQTQNTILTPTIVTVAPSQTVSRGSVVTLTATATPSVISVGFGTAATCTQTTGVIASNGYQWVQTLGQAVTLSSPTTATTTFTAPTPTINGTITLVFTATATDSNGVTSAITPASTTQIIVR